MKKVILFLFFVNFLFSVDFKTYQDYANQLIKYELQIKKPIYDPFKEEVIKKVKKKKIIKKVKKKKIIKRIKTTINLFAILNKKILLSIKDENGKEDKWIKKNEVFKGYKLMKIANSYVVLQNVKDKKEKLVRLYHNQFNIKVNR